MLVPEMGIFTISTTGNLTKEDIKELIDLLKNGKLLGEQLLYKVALTNIFVNKGDHYLPVNIKSINDLLKQNPKERISVLIDSMIGEDLYYKNDATTIKDNIIYP